MRNKTHFIRTVAIIGSLVLMLLTVLPGCNFIGQANEDDAVVDTQGNELCCPVCTSTNITGPDDSGNYTCNDCGAVWSYNDEQEQIDIIGENGETVSSVDINAGYASSYSNGGSASSGGANGGGTYSGSGSSSNGSSGGNSGSSTGGGSNSGSGSKNNGSGSKTPSNGNQSGNNGGSSSNQSIDMDQIRDILKNLDDSVNLVYDEETKSWTAKNKQGVDTGLFGYKYHTEDKIFYTAEDSWQRNFGFAEVYDKAAAIGFMTYNTFRVYFTYDNLEWMIQFWKGQYGYAFIGAEIGVYTRPAGSDNGTFYGCADDAHKFYMTMDVYRRNVDNKNKFDHLFTRSRVKTWWCTGFVPGTLGFAKINVPDQDGTATLKVDSKIEFYNPEMAHAFMNGLSKVKYLENNAALAGTKRSVNFIQCGSEEEYNASSSSCKYALCADGSSVRVCYR